MIPAIVVEWNGSGNLKIWVRPFEGPLWEKTRLEPALELFEEKMRGIIDSLLCESISVKNEFPLEIKYRIEQVRREIELETSIRFPLEFHYLAKFSEFQWATEYLN